MGTYVIFDKGTGRIVHTHTEASLLGEALPRSHESVLAITRRILDEIPSDRLDFQVDNLAVLEIDQDLLRQIGPSRQAYVDIERRVLADREISQD
jgi:hypothetical protein